MPADKDPTILQTTIEPEQHATQEAPQTAIGAFQIEDLSTGTACAGILIKNIFLSIITLGIYSFWGSTHLRRYVIDALSLNGERFEYHGQGASKFISTLKIIPVVLFLLAPYMIDGAYEGMHEMEDTDAEYESPGWLLLWMLVNLPFLFIAYPLAKYLRIRYLLQHVSWKGQRGALHGSAITYGFKSLGYSILNLFTLGLMIPKNEVKKHGYIIENMRIAGMACQFKPKTEGLYLSAFCGSLLSILFLIPGILLFTVPIKGDMPLTVDIACLIAGAVLCGYALFWGFAWYRAKFTKMQMRSMTIGDMSFDSDVTGGGLVRLSIGNLFLNVVTLGLGRQLALLRRWRYWATHISISGTLPEHGIGEIGAKDGKTGEALSESLAVFD